MLEFMGQMTFFRSFPLVNVWTYLRLELQHRISPPMWLPHSSSSPFLRVKCSLHMQNSTSVHRHFNHQIHKVTDSKNALRSSQVVGDQPLLTGTQLILPNDDNQLLSTSISSFCAMR